MPRNVYFSNFLGSFVSNNISFQTIDLLYFMLKNAEKVDTYLLN